MSAMTPPIKPRNKPSKRKGQRMNQFVAPTYFMMAISLRRAKTVRRIVLEMMNNMARVKKTMRAMPPQRMMVVILKS